MQAENIIKLALSLRPTSIPKSTFYMWLYSCEVMVANICGLEANNPIEPDTVLILPQGFEHIYMYYLVANIDLYEGAIETYNSFAAMFTLALNEYDRMYGARRAHNNFSNIF